MSILKDSVSPALTLIEVAYPWSEGAPSSFTCQFSGASPGSAFSHTIGLAAIEQLVSAASAGAGEDIPKRARRVSRGTIKSDAANRCRTTLMRLLGY